MASCIFLSCIFLFATVLQNFPVAPDDIVKAAFPKFFRNRCSVGGGGGGGGGGGEEDGG